MTRQIDPKRIKKIVSTSPSRKTILSIRLTLRPLPNFPVTDASNYLDETRESYVGKLATGVQIIVNFQSILKRVFLDTNRASQIRCKNLKASLKSEL
jgi:hypothetical protein